MGLGDVVELVIRCTRWSTLRHDRACVADWREHAGAAPALGPAPFPLRTQTSADLGAARWGLLAWEDPSVGMAASPFWVDEAMPKGRFVETDDADPKAILVLLEETGATLARLRLPDGALVLRIARGRKSGQLPIPDADAADAARCALAVTIAVDGDFAENLDRAAVVCTVVWPRRQRLPDGRHSEWKASSGRPRDETHATAKKPLGETHGEDAGARRGRGGCIRGHRAVGLGQWEACDAGALRLP